jgi:hypothetical protein
MVTPARARAYTGMSKMLRSFLLVFAVLTPTVALASDAADCCSSGHCCPGCPFCHHHA